jgi:hypothetical protein
MDRSAEGRQKDDLASPRVIAHALLLDFGPGPAAPNAAPPWNCSLALAEHP